MATEHTIVVVPAQRTLDFGSTSVPIISAASAVELAQHQAHIHRCNIILVISDANNKTVYSRYFINANGEHGKRSVVLDKALPTRETPLSIDGWQLFIDDQVKETFYTLKEFSEHCQSIANTHNVSFKVNVLDVTPAQPKIEMRFRSANDGEKVDTGKLEQLLLDKESLQAAPSATSLVEEEPELDEELHIKPSALVEVQESAPATGQLAVVPLPEEPADPETESHAIVELETSTLTSAALEDIATDVSALIDDLFTQDMNETEEEEAPITRKYLKPLLIGGATFLTLALAATGYALVSNNSSEDISQATFSTSSLAVPAGYAAEPAWALDIPAENHIQAGRAATALISPTHITLYSSDDGSRIREVAIEEPITADNGNAIGNTTIDGQPALIWAVGDTITAYTADMGVSGELITAKLDTKPQVYASGENLLIISGAKTFTLTGEGLKEFTVPAGMHPMAVDDNQLISGSFDLPLQITDATGTSRSVTLQSPEGYGLNSYVHAGDGLSSSIWTQDPTATCTDTNTSGCNDTALVLVHSLTDGTITYQHQGTLAQAQQMQWTDGDSQSLAALGNTVISVQTGQALFSVPEDHQVTGVKGHYVLTERSGQRAIFDESTQAGNYISSATLAVGDSSIIVQQGKTALAFPANN